MKRSINGATMMPFSLEEDIRVAAQAGFAGLEIWWDKLDTHVARTSVSDVRDRLADSGLEAVSICPLRIWPFRDIEPARAEFRKAIEIAPQLGCEVIAVCPDYQPAQLQPAQAMSLHASELADMAERAADHGVRLSIEAIGRHTLVSRPAEALQLIDRAGTPDNVGLVLDTFHLFRSQVTQAELIDVPVAMVDAIQVNDCENGAIDELTDADRLYPTLGVLPAAELLAPLVRNGFDGYLSVEIFRPEYWGTPSETIATSSFAHLGALIDQVTHLINSTTRPESETTCT